MRWGGIALALLLLSACTSNPRYLRTRIRLSPLCTLTLIQDRRTGQCLASYSCGMLREDAYTLVPVPKEVCEP